jgi:hypothetical protein
MLLIDYGKATLGFTTIKLTQLPTSDVDMKLQRIGPSSWYDSGSHTLNGLFLDWIRSGRCAQVPDLPRICAKMGLVEKEFMRQASDEFDGVKERISATSGYTVEIHDAVNDETPHGILLIRVPLSLILTWSNEWASGAQKFLREYLTQSFESAARHNQDLHFAYALLTGGGNRSDIFGDAIEEVLGEPQYGIKVRYNRYPSACARGALRQHA